MDVSGQRNATVWLIGTVPFGNGLTAAPSTGDGLGDTRTGRSASDEGVSSAEEGRGG